MAGQLSIGGVARALRHREYAIYTASNTAVLIGEWMQRVGVGWLTWELTQSTSWLGIIACADMVPCMLVSPVAGAYADRNDRLSFIRKATILATLQPAVLCLLFFVDLLDIWLLGALAVYNGVMGAFNQAARLAIIPNLVDRADLSPAVALSSITYNTSRFLGPAAAGSMIAVLGVGYTFVASLLFFVVFTIALYCIRLKHDEAPAGRGQPILTDAIEGVRYTMRHPGIGPVMFLLVVGSLGQRPFIDLLPGYADTVFQRGPEALGWMVSMVGLGALFGAFYLASRATMHGLTRVAVHAFVGTASVLICLTLSDNFWIAMGCLFFIGMSMSTATTGIMTLVQAAVDSTMRGRVLSLYGVIFRGGPAIGALLMGMAAEYIGLRIPIAIGAAFCILLWAWVVRDLKQTALVLEAEPPPIKLPVLTRVP